ncbi:ORF106 [Helicoverpa armigera SNPV]|nr:ORF106 [Helicoverpa SNPV AC53]AIG63285.2 ORF106 [Helicoverpa armigera SNPV]AMN15343.2 ORF106 [Helicoverpa SNPV AC53]AMN15482.2 ORF106 [Helicoverpa SNPV AC53]AMN15619.2 ORF106 [Helicoverpa SNPV AC53]
MLQKQRRQQICNVICVSNKFPLRFVGFLLTLFFIHFVFTKVTSKALMFTKTLLVKSNKQNLRKIRRNSLVSSFMLDIKKPVLSIENSVERCPSPLVR